MKMNKALTKKVTELHSQGYDGDFSLDQNQQLVCIQNNHVFLKESIAIKLVDQIYDRLFNHYKYLYVVESDSGERGILLLNYVHFDAICGSGADNMVN
jgi:hypothetical protein